jgi:hypothetical protein
MRQAPSRSSEIPQEEAPEDEPSRASRGVRPFILGFVTSLVLLVIGAAVGLALGHAGVVVILALAGPIALIALAVVKGMPSAAWGSAAAIVAAPLIVFGGCLMLLSGKHW